MVVFSPRRVSYEGLGCSPSFVHSPIQKVALNNNVNPPVVWAVVIIETYVISPLVENPNVSTTAKNLSPQSF